MTLQKKLLYRIKYDMVSRLNSHYNTISKIHKTEKKKYSWRAYH